MISRNLTVNSEVVVVLEGGKAPTKGKIIEVISRGANGGGSARIALGGDENKVAIATYSNTGEVGSFHFPDETKTVKENADAQPANGKTEATATAPKIR